MAKVGITEPVKPVDAEQIPVPEETLEEARARIERTYEDVYISTEGAGGETVMFVGLNGRTWAVPRGKKQRVPRPVADIIRQRMRTEREARKFNEEQARKMSDPALQG